MPIATDELSKNAMGGTEMMKYGLQDRIDSSLLDHFHVTASRYRGPQDGKLELYWLHDLPGDPESQHLANGGWNKFEKLIFVSNWNFNNTNSTTDFRGISQLYYKMQLNQSIQKKSLKTRSRLSTIQLHIVD